MLSDLTLTMNHCISLVNEFFSWDLNSRQFKRHLSKLKKREARANQVLVEFEQPPDNIIAISRFLPLLLEKYNASPRAYMMFRKTKISFISRKLRYFFSVSRRLLGNGLAELSYDSKKVLEEFPDIIAVRNRIHNAEDLLSLSINGILLGDLIYDKYLSTTHNPTLDVHSNEFFETLNECLFYFFKWCDLLTNSSVKALCVSHSVYHFGIPLRVALAKDIEVFQISIETVFRLSVDRPFAYMEESEFPALFRSLPTFAQEAGIKRAKEELAQHFSGKLTAALPYLKLASFSNGEIQVSRARRDGGLRILVATHDFYDSPHVFGDFFYADFFAWLERLGEISQKTNYTWLIKTHPYLRGPGRKVLAKLCENYPRFVFLDANISHNQILESGVDFVLTVYGTIAMEYACFGIPTINASRNNPHIAYSFSHTPANRSEYEDILYNLEDYRNSFTFDEVYEYYFVKHILRKKSWIFQDMDKYLEDTKFREFGIRKNVYSYFLGNENVLSLDSLMNQLNIFVYGHEYRLTLF